MMQRNLAIELLDDCVFSARSATEGGHESLDRVPGAALLGAVAGRLYRTLDRKQAFSAFHSGRLRFGDGLPFDGQSVAYPMPYCWHHAKELSPETGRGREKRLVADRVHNFLLGADLGGAQPKQIRTGYVSPRGHRVVPVRALRMKTAVDPETGRAADGQLFGYDALGKGQRFATRIEADPDFDPELFERVIDALLQDQVLLGRSRSAEYGRVRLTPMDLPVPRPGAIGDRRVTLWLLSDLALADDHGQPTLAPDAAALGLPLQKVLWDSTFLRARRYSPWNAARGGYDRERLVLAAGGVITLDLTEPLDPTQATRLHDGIGLHREAGLGRLWVNPPLLADRHPRFENQALPAASGIPVVKPDHPLIYWLERQSGDDWKAAEEARARELARAYAQQVQRARRAAGISEDKDFGPSKAQWGRVLDAARNRSGQALHDLLFRGDAAIVKPGGAGWSVEAPGSEGSWLSLGAWLTAALSLTGTAPANARAYAHLVRELSHRVRDDIEKRRV